MVADTADKVWAIAERGVPLVISSSPQGGSSAPIQEAGMVAQIHAEILAGMAFTQLINPGTPVLYGSVPVRARLDDLHDLYGCPEFNQYNIDCVQLARHYHIPCYSSAGVGDAKAPGMQAVYEKLFTQLYMAMSGAQYIHYALGLLDRTNTFCPVQAVLDNEQLGQVKHCLRRPKVGQADIAAALKIVDKVMASSNRLFARHARKAMHAGDISEPYRFEAKGFEDQVLIKAVEEERRLEAIPGRHMEPGHGGKDFRAGAGHPARSETIPGRMRPREKDGTAMGNDKLLKDIAFNVVQGRVEAEDDGFDEGLEGKTRGDRTGGAGSGPGRAGQGCRAGRPDHTHGRGGGQVREGRVPDPGHAGLGRVRGRGHGHPGAPAHEGRG